jgi:hypothetical protein
VRTAKTLRVLATAAALLLPGLASADTEGRISVTNVYETVTGPDATFDAALFRVYLRSESISGRNVALIVDARSDYVVMDDAAKKPDQDFGLGATVFSSRCRGFADVNDECRDAAIREQRLGQMAHLAGVYDAFLRFGEVEEGKFAVSFGRRTIYEAGLSTVDGATVERGFDRARVGVFLGAAPNPVTRMFNGQYQTAGSYFAMQRQRFLLRAGVVGQAFEGGIDRVTITNHDFFAISRSMRISAMVNFDVIPDAQERLVQLDFTFRPSGQYRVRASVIRFRPSPSRRTS